MGPENTSGKLSTSEKAKLEIVEFLKDAKVGDPRYQAFWDWNLKQELKRELNYKIMSEDHLETRMKEKEVHILENRAANLDNLISQRVSVVPEYLDSYLQIMKLFENLEFSIHGEETRKHIDILSEDDIDYYTRVSLNKRRGEIWRNLIDKTVTECPQREQFKVRGIIDL
jgi:hypothetical protein